MNLVLRYLVCIFLFLTHTCIAKMIDLDIHSKFNYVENKDKNFNSLVTCTLVASISSKTQLGCDGIKIGTATVTASGGTGPYTYQWLPFGGTNATASGLTEGTYTVTVTDANACQVSQTFTVEAPDLPLSATTTFTNVSCPKGTNGTINITPSGGISPYSYKWNDGITTEDRNNLKKGIYSVLITDAAGCTIIKSVTINESALAINLISVSNANCGFNNGELKVEAQGGTAPYTYKLQGVTMPSGTFSNIYAGAYLVSVTDATGCTVSKYFAINDVEMQSIVLSQTNVSCNGGANGTVEVVNLSGASPVQYELNRSGTRQFSGYFAGLSAGTHVITVYDGGNCISNNTITITEPEEIIGIISVTPASYMGAADGAITLSPSGGKTPYTYNWGGGITTKDRTNLTSGNYTVTIKDANNCTKTYTLNLSALNSSPTANNDVLIINKNSSATIVDVLSNDNILPDVGETLTISGVSSAINGTTSLMSGVVRFTPAANFIGTTSFTYTISDGKGGLASATVNVTVNDVLPVDLVNFNAAPQNNAIKLIWSTASEQNNLQFEIEKSVDGFLFDLLAIVKGSNTSNTINNYHTFDKTPTNGTNYYRLSQVDYNGNYKHLGTTEVYYDLTGEKISIYPNPASKQITLLFPFGTEKIEIIDLNGRILQSLEIKKTENNFIIDTSNLIQGSYLVRLNGQSGTIIRNFIKL
ncbi:Ig-like domain-containing protein [Pedobacter glucosidilyticus]|uniref:Ig-like domain-containing protein n=1 Tax=Pedobacter glucosidilyticus TaxID=1122941 RepID=UPI0003F64CD7|nr:T9SS type A sorting domain-containing protein [Pedobacter glucosidilyticus]